MRPGKISQAVFERSVLRPLKAAGVLSDQAGYGKDVFWDDRVGYAEDRSGERCAEAAVRSAAFGAADGFCMPGAEMILDEAVCRLGAAEGIHLLLDLMLPADFEEERLKDIVVRLGREAERAAAVIDSVAVTISRAVSCPVLSVDAAGFRIDAGSAAADPVSGGTAASSGSAATPQGQGFLGYTGYDLLMAGCCGMTGTGILVRDFQRQLGKHFPENFLRKAEQMASGAIFPGQVLPAAGEGGAFVKAAGEGGVFAALWEMCEDLGCGLDADIHKIPIRQETVEICEYLNRNPYRLYSAGTFLLAARDGRTLQRQLLSEGVECSQIGKLTEGPGRYIRNREITRCLEKPLPDALLEEG